MSKALKNGRRLDLSGAVSVRIVDIDSISTIRKLKYESYMRLNAEYASDCETAAFTDELESSKYTEELYSTISKRQVYGAFLENRMVAIAAWSDVHEGQPLSRLDFLFVDPFFTRCGVGTKLLDTIECLVTSKHSREFSILTVMPSIGFFEKASYCTTSYGALPLSHDSAFEVAFMKKSEFSKHRVLSLLTH
ncbi:MAG: hypothetical protein TECD_00203 [Hyphomicrobiaceae bacterium hypho_1]